MSVSLSVPRPFSPHAIQRLTSSLVPELEGPESTYSQLQLPSGIPAPRVLLRGQDPTEPLIQRASRARVIGVPDLDPDLAHCFFLDSPTQPAPNRTSVTQHTAEAKKGRAWRSSSASQPAIIRNEGPQAGFASISLPGPGVGSGSHGNPDSVDLEIPRFDGIDAAKYPRSVRGELSQKGTPDPEKNRYVINPLPTTAHVGVANRLR